MANSRKGQLHGATSLMLELFVDSLHDKASGSLMSLAGTGRSGWGKVSHSKQQTILAMLHQCGIRRIEAIGHDGVNLSVAPYFQRSQVSLANPLTLAQPGMSERDITKSQVFLVATSQAAASNQCAIQWNSTGNVTITATDDLSSSSIRSTLGLISIGTLTDVAQAGGQISILTNSVDPSQAYQCVLDEFSLVLEGWDNLLKRNVPEATAFWVEYASQTLRGELMRRGRLDRDEEMTRVINNYINRLKQNPILAGFYDQLLKIYQINKPGITRSLNGAKSNFQKGAREILHAVAGHQIKDDSLPLVTRKDTDEVLVTVNALKSFLITIRNLRKMKTNDTPPQDVFNMTEVDTLISVHNTITKYFLLLINIKAVQVGTGSANNRKLKDAEALIKGTGMHADPNVNNGVLSESVNREARIKDLNDNLILNLTEFAESMLKLGEAKKNLIEKTMLDLKNDIISKLENAKEEQLPLEDMQKDDFEEEKEKYDDQPPFDVFANNPDTLKDETSGDEVETTGIEKYGIEIPTPDEYEEDEYKELVPLGESSRIYQKILSELLKYTK